MCVYTPPPPTHTHTANQGVRLAVHLHPARALMETQAQRALVKHAARAALLAGEPAPLQQPIRPQQSGGVGGVGGGAGDGSGGGGADSH